ncbi:MAG: CBS domain-containing protein [Gammaproteobacteria bacterium]|nr:CBS domain-containing protein [Gammaproteobacteria bacterium]MCP5425759.1 CBS domain-containing protein [Gammaproteobacteria bacterium]MCP5458630.1 CBS domain-containing protein [Gammaproteobacteria bacterium]
MLGLKARDILNRSILAVREDWPLDQLADFLADHHISGAPVISEEGELVGVVSLSDLVHYTSFQLREWPVEEPHSYYQHPLHNHYAREELAKLRIKCEPPLTVHGIMTPMIFQVSEDTPVAEIADTMIRGHIHRLFVTHEGRVIGIISALDVLKIVRDM